MPRMYTLSDDYDTIEHKRPVNNMTDIDEDETISVPEMSRQDQPALNNQQNTKDLVQLISEYNQVKDFHVIDIVE